MQDDAPRTAASETKHPGYEPPLVERVMDAEELAREVHYAGFLPVPS